MLRCSHLKATFIAVALCCLAAGNVATQGVKTDAPTIISGDNNESTKSELGLLAQNARLESGNAVVTGEQVPSLIFISRLGTGESSRKLNRRRLNDVRVFMEELYDVPKDEIVTAEGEPVRGRGRVEAYQSGKLVLIFTLPRNKSFASEP